MVGRNKFFAAAVGAVAALTLMSVDANAATSYFGTGTGGSSQMQSWINAVGNSYTPNVAITPTGTGNGAFNTPLVLPLAVSTGLTLQLAGSPSSGNLTGVGALTNILNPTATVFQDSLSNKSITISSFSPSITAFGFFLEAFSGGANSVTITLNDGSGTPTTINVPANGLSNTAAAFVGFTGMVYSPTMNIVLSSGIRYELGDFLESTATPTPEPASLALLGAGLVGLGLARRRKSA